MGTLGFRTARRAKVPGNLPHVPSRRWLLYTLSVKLVAHWTIRQKLRFFLSEFLVDYIMLTWEKLPLFCTANEESWVGAGNGATQSVQQGKVQPIGGMCLAIKMLYSYNLQVLGIYNQLAKATTIKLHVSGHRPHQFWEPSRKIIIILRMHNCAIAQC